VTVWGTFVGVDGNVNVGVSVTIDAAVITQEFRGVPRMVSAR